MVLKKPSILIWSYGGTQGLCYHHQICSIHTADFSHNRKPRTNKRSAGQPRRHGRGYADVRSTEPSSDTSPDLQWPHLRSATAIPTPYQIFNLRKGAPYSKRRFYELVKLYHPDRNVYDEDSSKPGYLSQAVKLERYRLIVAANDILSDPVRRNAYDRYGAGWNGQPACAGSQGWKKKASWSDFDNSESPAQNATWEDWEKWHHRDSKPKQEPLYFSNGGVFSVIVFVAILAGMGQVTRVGELSKSFIEQVEAMHDESSKDLQRRRIESQNFMNKDARVHNFLKVRDPVGYGITDPSEEGYRKLLPAPEICMSGNIKDRALDEPRGT
ncbi:MAG: hypothetical protein Q9187_004398 [Circinaria calcarea]